MKIEDPEYHLARFLITRKFIIEFFNLPKDVKCEAPLVDIERGCISVTIEHEVLPPVEDGGYIPLIVPNLGSNGKPYWPQFGQSEFGGDAN